MLSFRRLNEELALIDVELSSLGFPKFYGQNEKFMGWFSTVAQLFACYNLGDWEKFKVVISRLRGCALQWWKNYKFKRRKKGKEKVRTWKKLRSKLMVAFCPPTYMFLHFLRRMAQSPHAWMTILTRGVERVLALLAFPPWFPWRNSSPVRTKR